MATIVLGAVGGALFGPPGAIVGAIAGAALDQHVIAPAIFPQPDAPRASSDINNIIRTGQEGTVSRWPIGTIRVPGMIMWASDLIPTGNSNNPSWARHVAVAAPIGKQISRFVKIYADGKKIYDADLSETVGPATNIGAGIQVFRGLRYLVATEFGSSDILALTIGHHTTTVSGFTNPGNNGVFSSILDISQSSDGSSVSAVIGPALSVAESAGNSITIAQVIFPFNPGKITDVTFYNGTNTQNPDSFIESFEGVGQVPGFRGTPYAVIQGLGLLPFGNRLPDFDFLVEADAPPVTVGDAIGELLQRAGRPTTSFDVTGAAIPLRGFYVDGAQSTESPLQVLMQAFNIVVQDRNGVLTFFTRDTAEVITIDSDDLASHEEGGDAPRVARLIQEKPGRIPKEVNVQFQEFGNEYQKGSQRERRINPPSNLVKGINLTVALTAQEAREVARRQLWSDAASQLQFEIQVPPSYIDNIESDVARFTADGTTYEGMVLEVNQGANGLIQMRGVIQHTSSSSQAGDADAGVGVPVDIGTPIIDFTIMDIPGLTNEFAINDGFYLGGVYTDPDLIWGGGTLFKSIDDFNFLTVTDFISQGGVGRATTVLPGGPQHYLDLTSTVDVHVRGVALSSVSESDVFAGANHALIGQEIVAFRTVTALVGTGNYRLSNLLRGRRDTESFIGSHVVDEPFTLLTGSDLSGTANTAVSQFVPLNPQDINAFYHWKALPPGEQIEDVNSQFVVISGAARKPFTPAHVRGKVSAPTNDMTIFWNYQTIGLYTHFTGLFPRFFDDAIIYEVDFYDGPGPNANKFFTATETNVPTNPAITRITREEFGEDRAQLTLTTARKVELGLNTNDPVTFEVIQVSDTYGRGRSGRITLDPLDHFFMRATPSP